MEKDKIFVRGTRFFVGGTVAPPCHDPEVTVELSRPTVHVTHVGYVIYFWMQQTRYCPVEQDLFAKKKYKFVQRKHRGEVISVWQRKNTVA